ncbi:hypothetical protein ACWD3J_34400 [Streptomyces sp. NPDC002755]|uniref:hypothetical protein n=1 Tax=Streptomyces sp. NPDC002884 TaxID=3154544 RepID=UPI00332934F0
MGVLARIFRRSRTTEKATAETTETAGAADAPAATPADDVEAERTGERTDGPTSAREPAEAEEAEDAGDVAGTEPVKTTEPVAVAATDGVEIPRQQSAEEAADSEAGEAARA